MTTFRTSHLKDIDEKFCQCSICLQQYKEPKLLPCLHRYCSDCLKQLIEKNQGVTMISCPECRGEVIIPTEGVDGFKTDFYMKNIIEYIVIQKSLEPKVLRECFDCSKKLNVASYCFKCHGFLCKDCHENHMNKRSLEDHKRHTLSSEDLKSKHMTVEKLADLKEAPRCESHLKDLCLLCCRTCNNRPICVTCTYGSHKNHDINDVGIIAAEVRERLTKDLKNLSQYEEQVLKIPQTMESVKEKLISNVREKKENLAQSYDTSMQAAINEMKKIEEGFNLTQTETESRENTQLIEAREQMDEEMNKVKIKFDKIFDEIKEKSRVTSENLRRNREEDLQKNRAKIAILEKEFETCVKTLNTGQEDELFKLENVSKQIHNLTERYDNLTKTGNSVLETTNDWTAVQCIPDICKAIEPLKEDMKKKFPEFNSLLRVPIIPEITEDRDSPVEIEGFTVNQWDILGITGVGDGNIVITGRTPGSCQSHITVINMNGGVLYRKELRCTSVERNRYCAYLSKFKVATVCMHDEVGVFDIRDNSCMKKTISDVINTRRSKMWARSLATDPVNNRIYVGVGSRNVYVFDDQLNYYKTLTLPEIIFYPYDMTSSAGKLLVCDKLSRKAYVVTIGGFKCEVIHEFTKPEFDRDHCIPLSVCTDKNGFIYILWETDNDRFVVTKYAQVDRQLLTRKQINVNDPSCITVVEIGVTQKLLVATLKSAKLHIYSIT
ncbi:E3 ubiquitin-protein ligase TRIM56 [Holothuria leucospilota]|uniref:E3 ubiquitin-protein ligase TRIM56 n=1 Tax=Holothuria leucospilota TaxID=206669 RepID=A0A9Q1CEL5_HOLLE|nr:E3 ubiquitin-protein ligase TRIM56 [Holothuria leucospilota]